MNSEPLHLFGQEGEAALAATMAADPLLAFDFDGTLAPIVARPELAYVPLPVLQRLKRLSSVLPVAILTGRTVADVRARLGFEPAFIVGNHGAEDPQAGVPEPAQALDALRMRLLEQAGALEAIGIVVEDKLLSVALHYRRARDPQRALACIADLVEGLGPELSVFGGKLVVNLAPARAPDKADALARLVERRGVRRALFVGDDVNDEPVFARQRKDWLTVRIGFTGVHSRATFRLDDVDEVAGMLDRLLALSQRSPRC
jgi:trehalose 6-phosphate phosphatase